MSRIQWTRDPCDRLCGGQNDAAIAECYQNIIDLLSIDNRSRAHKIDGLESEGGFIALIVFIIVFSAIMAVFILTD